jgi:hypothetical protein
VRAVIAENLILKQQLIVLRRARQRAPNLALSDRLICALGSLFLSSGRIRKVAIGVRHSTLLAFHQALVRRKYRRLFSSSQCPKTPGPKGPSDALIQAIVELKSRNPRFGYPRIARIISHAFGIDIDKHVVYRVLSKHYRPASGGTGPSWLSFIGHTRDSLGSVDLFRCESIVLRSYWVLVVMDQFTRRLVGIGVQCGPSRVPTSAACSTPRFTGRAYRDISVRITIPCSRPTGGGRTCGFWKSTKSRASRTCCAASTTFAGQRQLFLPAKGQQRSVAHLSLAKTGVARLSLTIANTSRREPSCDTTETSDADAAMNAFAFKRGRPSRTAAPRRHVERR